MLRSHHYLKRYYSSLNTSVEASAPLTSGKLDPQVGYESNNNAYRGIGCDWNITEGSLSVIAKGYKTRILTLTQGSYNSGYISFDNSKSWSGYKATNTITTDSITCSFIIKF